MNRKLSALSLILFLLVGVGAYLWFFGKPSAPKQNPLKYVDTTKVSRLIITNRSIVTKLEKKNGTWNVTEPVADIADQAVPNEIVESLKGFSVGTVVSENPARYSEFQLDDAQAARVDVYLEGQDKAAFSGFIGKINLGYDSCYFRFAVSSGPVYIANGLREYQFRREPTSFRSPNVLTLSSEDPVRIKLVNGKKSWEMAKSSATYKSPSGAVVDQQTASNIVRSLRELRADNFGTGTEQPSALGFDSPDVPYAVLTVEEKATSYTVTVGKLAPKVSPQAVAMRYVRVGGRNAVLLTQDTTLTNIINSISKLPK